MSTAPPSALRHPGVPDLPLGLSLPRFQVKPFPRVTSFAELLTSSIASSFTEALMPRKSEPGSLLPRTEAEEGSDPGEEKGSGGGG